MCSVKHSTQLPAVQAVQAVPYSCQQCKQYKRYNSPTSGKNEVLPDPPRAKASSAVAASVKGLRASCEEEFGLSARYCSTEVEKVTRPSGSLSRCCSSGASHGKAITAE